MARIAPAALVHERATAETPESPGTLKAMGLHDRLLDLQWRQLKNDEAFHADILQLPISQRLKHMALHNAKYTSHFIHNVVDTDRERHQTTLTDAFVIALATANALNQNLGEALCSQVGEASSLQEAGEHMASSLARDPHNAYWIGHCFSYHTGQFAKACESLDHLEGYQYREVIEEANLSLFKAILAEASAMNLDLWSAYDARTSQMGQKSIFVSYRLSDQD